MPEPISERGYPHAEMLAETGWLAEHLSDPMVRVVDAGPDKNYDAGHIPGAVHINGYTLCGLRLGSEMPEPEAFAQLIGSVGIDETTRVVVYDEGATMAGLVAWAFLYYGHPDTRFLDGGLSKWTAEGRSLSGDVPVHEPRTFSAHLQPAVYCSLDQAKVGVDSADVMFWDTRSQGEFDGSKAGWNPPPRLGHLPGAIHLEWSDLFDAQTLTLKPADELSSILAAVGITPEASVATY